MRRRIPLADLRKLRPAAHHDLRPGQIEVDERPDILLHRHAPDIQKYGPRQLGPWITGPRAERSQIDAASPRHDIAKTALPQLLPQARRGNHHASRWTVESPEERIERPHRKSGARADILGKSRVKRRGEGETPPQRPATRRHSQRTLGRNVQVGRAESLRHRPQPTGRPQRQADFRIGGAGEGAEPVGPDHLDPIRHIPQQIRKRAQGAYHPVHLRLPGVADDKNPACVCHSLNQAARASGVKNES